VVTKELVFGLSKNILLDFNRVFTDFPEIERVLIFGSRAKGTFKDGSDIDLAVFSPTMSEQHFTKLWNQLDALPLAFKIDVLHWNKLGNERLKNRIPVEGKVLYPPIEKP
jgi:predicted nucleotidyltransferase